ncbi:MAG: hypothetical protein AAF921_22615 [Cyanobacteria bacterium P01_D01_bin.44]
MVVLSACNTGRERITGTIELLLLSTGQPDWAIRCQAGLLNDGMVAIAFPHGSNGDCIDS